MNTETKKSIPVKDKVIAWNDLTKKFWNLGVAEFNLENIEGEATEYSNDNDSIQFLLEKKFKSGKAKFYSPNVSNDMLDLRDMRRGQKYPIYFHANDLIQLCEKSAAKRAKKEFENIDRVENKKYPFAFMKKIAKTFDENAIDVSKHKVGKLNDAVEKQKEFIENLDDYSGYITPYEPFKLHAVSLQNT